VNSLWRSWPQLKKSVSSQKKKLLLLDFDGTLTPIVSHPNDVVLDERTEAALYCLSRSPLFQIAIITGRSLRDLRSYLSLKNIIYVGNHGFEFKGRRLSAPVETKKANGFLSVIARMAEKLEESFRDVPGVYLENKRYTLSLHFRGVSEKDRPVFQKKLADLRERHRNLPLLWRRGKKVWEIRPALSWGKGKAALYIMKHFPRALPIVIGDDKTDEEMFEALEGRAITVRVGFSRSSKASYYVQSTQDVTRLLEELSCGSDPPYGSSS
jgi:trehalose-phosphatase